MALARALAVEPKLLLLDEPFGALDAQVRKDLRRWLRTLHEAMGLTSIFVTHDQDEALELADRVAVMNHGQIEQVGTPEQIYTASATPFVSQFVGETNLLPRPTGGDIHVRPHEIEIVADGDGGAADAYRVIVRNVFRRGPFWRVEGALGVDARLVAMDVSATGPAPVAGQVLSVRARDCRSFPRAAREG